MCSHGGRWLARSNRGPSPAAADPFWQQGWWVAACHWRLCRPGSLCPAWWFLCPAGLLPEPFVGESMGESMGESRPRRNGEWPDPAALASGLASKAARQGHARPRPVRLNPAPARSPLPAGPTAAARPLLPDQLPAAARQLPSPDRCWRSPDGRRQHGLPHHPAAASIRGALPGTQGRQPWADDPDQIRPALPVASAAASQSKRPCLL